MTLRGVPGTFHSCFGAESARKVAANEETRAALFAIFFLRRILQLYKGPQMELRSTSGIMTKVKVPTCNSSPAVLPVISAPLGLISASLVDVRMSGEKV